MIRRRCAAVYTVRLCGLMWSISKLERRVAAVRRLGGSREILLPRLRTEELGHVFRDIGRQRCSLVLLQRGEDLVSAVVEIPSFARVSRRAASSLKDVNMAGQFGDFR